MYDIQYNYRDKIVFVSSSNYSSKKLQQTTANMN